MVMRNPLNKRIFREFRSEFGKYAVIFLFMVLTIGLESGDMVASDSMIATCNERYQKYHVENGHFHLKQAMKDKAIEKIEKDDVTIYPGFMWSVPIMERTRKKKSFVFMRAEMRSTSSVSWMVHFRRMIMRS